MKFDSKKLLALMKAREESFHKASKRIGLSPAGLWNVANNKSVPNMKTLGKIAEGYGVPASFFMD